MILDHKDIFLGFFTEEQVDVLIEEACNPSRTERLPNENLVLLEKYIKEFSAKNVYTHSTTSKEPLTGKVRKLMTRNVKVSAYADLLSLKNRDNPRGNDTKFVEDDQKIFNFARDDLKNASTQIPVRLLELLYS